MLGLGAFEDKPEDIFSLKDEEVLRLVGAKRVDKRKTHLPEDALSNHLYLPTNFSLTCQPYTESKKISKGEKECKRVLEKVYGREFMHVRPDFISNKRNLELDCFCPSLGIACEYHGKQHYIYPSRYKKRKKDFVDQIRRDLYKMLTCRKLGIYLIIVPHTIKVADIEKYILARLPPV